MPSDQIPKPPMPRPKPPMPRMLFALGLCAIVMVGAGCTSFRAARLYHSGTEAMSAGEPVLAVAELEQAAELAPQSSEIQNHLGLAYSELGRDLEALHSFERAVELDCDNEAARTNLDRALAARAPQHGVADGR